MKKIGFMDVSFRDGFQSVLGARVKTEDFLPALKGAVDAGTTYLEVGGGARFQSLYFYCQEDAFDMMDKCRETVGPDVNLQTLARGVNVVGLSSQPRDIVNLHAKLFKKHGITTIRNFDALNDVRNLEYSGRCIHDNGLKHQIVITMMGLPPGLRDSYPHSAKFYIDKVQNILDAEIPFHSLCFKDASGTTPPQTVFETVHDAKHMLPEGVELQLHTHCTAGIASTCYMAAIEAGADAIDLAMVPLSGGTGAPDILTMWHLLRGTEYTLDIDYEEYLKVEELFEECLAKYFMPPEAREVNPLITLSPMPGGALTANTQMMRDNDCLDLYPEVIKAMREVVERGGFGTSVTPVSQFYFQQAFANVTQGAWERITEGYGKMVLGYFGRTPAKPDPEIVKLAANQLGMAPTEEAVVDINDADPTLGVEAARKKLQEAELPDTEENIFIVATCEDKGLEFLKGNKPMGIRYKEEEAEKKEEPPAPPAPAPAPPPPAAQPPAPAPKRPAAAAYCITVDGRQYHVEVAPTGAGAAPVVESVSEAAPTPQPQQAPAAAPAQPPPAAPAPAPEPQGAEPTAPNQAEESVDAAPAAGSAAADGQGIAAPTPGAVLRIVAQVGDTVSEGDVILVLEAMKMEIEIKAPAAGKVRSIDCAVGDSVKAGQVLATM